MAKVDDNVFPKIIEAMNTTDPAAPSDASWKIYAKAPGIYARSSNAVVGPFGTSSYVTGELDYVQYTSPVNVTATSEATANTIVTGSAVSYDGSTIVYVEFFAPYATTVAGANMYFTLYDGSSSIGLWSLALGAASLREPVFLQRRLTPSNASHTYSVRGFTDSGTAVAGAGAGGAAAVMPGFIRIRRA